jgi:3-deoxy-D-manno-octulosonate 8-phosphate phosphatase (KDO 8-P phosphatase)
MPESQPEKASRSQIYARVRAIALDVDGVLTDGGFWWGADGEESKRFCFADVMGLSLARRAGMLLALVSGEDSPLVDRYAEKMLIKHVIKGCRDKAGALRQLSSLTGIGLQEFCYMGDDINDIPAMEIAGVSFAPASAHALVLSHAQFVTRNSGGNGAVREMIDAVLDAQGIDPRETLKKK